MDTMTEKDYFHIQEVRDVCRFLLPKGYLSIEVSFKQFEGKGSKIGRWFRIYHEDLQLVEGACAEFETLDQALKDFTYVVAKHGKIMAEQSDLEFRGGATKEVGESRLLQPDAGMGECNIKTPHMPSECDGESSAERGPDRPRVEPLKPEGGGKADARDGL